MSGYIRVAAGTGGRACARDRGPNATLALLTAIYTCRSAADYNLKFTGLTQNLGQL
jgi:hypothetical protein